jgi:hypothetical protein
VTKPSSVARQGTIAGTQVRLSIVNDPILIGWNKSDRATASAVGQRASGIGCLIGFGNFHISRSLYHGESYLECAGKAKRRRRFGCVLEQSRKPLIQSGVVLRLATALQIGGSFISPITNVIVVN